MERTVKAPTASLTFGMLGLFAFSFSPQCRPQRPGLDVRAQIREWPNLNGERVVTKPKQRKAKTITDGLTMSRGNVVLGALGVVSWSTALFGQTCF